MNMNKTLRISFALKNAYRVNSILYAIRQIPFVKKIVPVNLYGVRGPKIFANILSVIWEILSAFLGKFLYFITMVMGVGILYKKVPSGPLFLHILVFLTVIGCFTNTFMFNPTRDKYYAMILMRMDARKYTLANYGYAVLKTIVGFLPFSVLFGLWQGLHPGLCLLIPFFVSGMKLAAAAGRLIRYEKTGKAPDENHLGKTGWASFAGLLAAAYGLPALGWVLPAAVSAVFMILGILCGLFSIKKILTFDNYRDMYQQLLINSMNQMDAAKNAASQASRKVISVETGISSRKKGAEYLNELFIRRHQKILWRSSRKIALISGGLVCGMLLAFYLRPEIKDHVNGMLMIYLPYFVFVMYLINRGTGFTQALFMNCDHSFLTYPFYRNPKFVLKLFKIRLREIIKVNLLPAAVIGAGMAVLLYASGGTENPINYGVLFVSIICMSVFFSVHYLTIYYLLQPYNAGTEMKSGTYRMILWMTYFVCYGMMKLKMPTPVFGAMMIGFSALYCMAACILIYKFAPKTFRLRM